jgi:6-pyruvoyltetrahydropterin/6-carboxytetrahydropterin synthase
MFRLTREVRFAVNARGDEPADPDGPSAAGPSNSYGGFPSLTGLGHFFTIQVTLAGELDPRSQYLRNIKDIDAAVRRRAVPAVAAAIRDGSFGGGGRIAASLFDLLQSAWPPAKLEALRLSLSPFLAYTVLASEHPMVRLSQKFEFSASHRLHSPHLSEEENCATFGKCSNPHGHGHNYEVQVTLAGEPDENGLLINVPKFERIVTATVIDRFDHKNLNLEVPEFRRHIPTVENIAMAIYRLLKPKLADAGAELASVTVWETPKTWCEYSE